LMPLRPQNIWKFTRTFTSTSTGLPPSIAGLNLYCWTALTAFSSSPDPTHAVPAHGSGALSRPPIGSPARPLGPLLCALDRKTAAPRGGAAPGPIPRRQPASAAPRLCRRGLFVAPRRCLNQPPPTRCRSASASVPKKKICRLQRRRKADEALLVIRQHAWKRSAWSEMGALTIIHSNTQNSNRQDCWNA